MTDARRYAVWPDPRSRSRSRALESLNSFHFQNLSPPPFTTGTDKWPLILKLEHNILIWSGRIFDIYPSFCVTWLWTWPKPQLWLSKKFFSDLNEIWYVARGWWVMLDWMSDSIQRSRIENLHSREVGRQSPTGLILSFSVLYIVVF